MRLFGEYAYTIECAYTVEWSTCRICVLYLCLAHVWVFRNPVSIDTCPDGRICYFSFDWPTKALVSDERHDCSFFYGTILATTCRLASRQHVNDQL